MNKMKRYSLIAIAFVATLVSCNKLPVVDVPDEVPEEQLEEVVIGFAGDVSMGYDTKANTFVDELPTSLYWAATKGSGTSESQQWANTIATVSNRQLVGGKYLKGTIKTGKYVVPGAATYNFYVSNTTMTVGANTTVSATGGTNGTDVVVGRVSSSATNPAMTLTHIFGRIGSLSINAPGYTITNISWKVVGSGSGTGIAGVYNLRTGSWSSVTTQCTERTLVTDMLLIPGNYTVSVTFTATKDGKTKSATQSGTMSVVAGKKHNVTASPNMMAFDWDDDWDPGDDINL